LLRADLTGLVKAAFLTGNTSPKAGFFDALKASDQKKALLLLNASGAAYFTRKSFFTQSEFNQALTLAAEKGFTDLANALVEYRPGPGIYPFTLNIYPDEAVCNALKDNHWEVAEIILDNFDCYLYWPPNSKIWLPAVTHYNKDFFEHLLQKAQKSPHFTQLETVADVNGNTLFHLAVQKGNKEVIETLLRHQLNPNYRNQNGNTPLHNAAQLNRLEIAEILVDKVDINHRNSRGETALDLATNLEIRKLLIAKGGKISSELGPQL